MEYQEFLEGVQALDFIKDSATADAAVKAVLGLLASRLKEPQARRLAQRLPGPLDYEKLRGHQQKVALMISVEDVLADLSVQFHISRDQADRMVLTVFRSLKGALEPAMLQELRDALPPEWAQELDIV